MNSRDARARRSDLALLAIRSAPNLGQPPDGDTDLVEVPLEPRQRPGDGETPETRLAAAC